MVTAAEAPFSGLLGRREAKLRTGRNRHSEGDLIVGRGQSSAIGTLGECPTRYVRLIHLRDG
ncbi:hypothetical protein [Streptomyces sp. S.PNR 29]|uniref:hypothetical protein n=1 Tax=Streptomyces sp. S.PNR 29 TaxID=2973805 RepID=UPI0025AF384B|nr:hypothetical protein [Streptomyces sp. S.PNR 29]MDN0198824.1 hypothetical protein [Streptomyces sp. S.PNR 29]